MAESSIKYNWQPLLSCSQGRVNDLVRGGSIDGIATIKTVQPGSLTLDKDTTLTDRMLTNAKYQIKHRDTGRSIYAPDENQKKYLDDLPK